MFSRSLLIFATAISLAASVFAGGNEGLSVKERRQERSRLRKIKQMYEQYPSAKDRWPSRPKTGRAEKHTLRHQDREREYFVYVPSKLDPAGPAPLFFVLHGGGGEARSMEVLVTNFRFNELADRHGFIVVYPQGVDKSWNDGREADIIKADRQEIDDVGFFGKMINELREEFEIDPARICVTGMSNGGFMSFRLGRELTGTVTAIAPITATIPQAAFAKYDKVRPPVSLLLINGTEDPLVPYEGGAVKVGFLERGKTMSTTDSVEKFADLNGCRNGPEEELLKDRVPEDGLRISRKVYTSCRDNVRVELLSVIGGGHTWPGGLEILPERIVGRTCHDISAADYVVRFALGLDNN